VSVLFAYRIRLFAGSTFMNSQSNSYLAFRRILVLPSLLLICGWILSGCRSASADDANRGSKELFENCAPCHGENGSGNPAIGAPNIAGLNDWYVERQLINFREGVRGAHFRDVEGLRMGPMARSLATDEDVKDVAHRVGTMQIIRQPASLKGDPKAGASTYALCATCHGSQGEGNPALKAPRLAGTDDWYLASQLRKFRSGVRGTDPKDAGGRMMRPMALTLPDDDAIRNVVAYIGTLKP
jgi:cytochrome c553